MKEIYNDIYMAEAAIREIFELIRTEQTINDAEIQHEIERVMQAIKSK